MVSLDKLESIKQFIRLTLTNFPIERVRAAIGINI